MFKFCAMFFSLVFNFAIILKLQKKKYLRKLVGIKYVVGEPFLGCYIVMFRELHHQKNITRPNIYMETRK